MPVGSDPFLLRGNIGKLWLLLIGFSLRLPEGLPLYPKRGIAMVSVKNAFWGAEIRLHKNVSRSLN